VYDAVLPTDVTFRPSAFTACCAIFSCHHPDITWVTPTPVSAAGGHFCLTATDHRLSPAGGRWLFPTHAPYLTGYAPHYAEQLFTCYHMHGFGIDPSSCVERHATLPATCCAGCITPPYTLHSRQWALAALNTAYAFFWRRIPSLQRVRIRVLPPPNC